MLSEIPVRLVGAVPLIEVRLDGVTHSFVLDTGAGHSVISPTAAREAKLPVGWPSKPVTLMGIGGETARTQASRVKMVSLGSARYPDVEFLVGGSEPGGGAFGVLGGDFLNGFDVEYDLAAGVMRLVRPSGPSCAKANLAYWAGEKSVSVIPIRPPNEAAGHLVANVGVNGHQLSAMFDTGASFSVLGGAAAEAVGLSPKGANVAPGGSILGFGQDLFATWIGAVDSFELGDEVVYRTRLRFGDFRLQFSDAHVVIGADFFLSHRIYVSQAQRRLFVTYNGGPVFDLRTTTAVFQPPTAAVGVPGGESAARRSVP